MAKRAKKRRAAARKGRVKAARVTDASMQTVTEVARELALMLEARAEKRVAVAQAKAPFKRIGEYTDGELNMAVQVATEAVPQFWIIMRGVDAYIERRRRRQQRPAPDFREWEK